MESFALRRRGLAAGLGVGLLSPAFLRAQTRMRVRYARPPRDIDEAGWFPLRLLRLALQASEEPHQIESSRHVVVQERATRDLAAGLDTVDLLWTITSVERERRLRAVRVPIDRGLFGWRLLLVRAGEGPRFAGVRSLDDLRRFVLLQGDEWPDTEILRVNGLQLRTTSSLMHLFEMLERREGHAFPRSVEEIWWEKEKFAPRFEVEPQLALHYPSAMYYFTAPGNARLAQALERGLERLIENGEFRRVFQEHHAPLLARANLQLRTRLELRNPLLPASAPLRDARLWWRPGETAGAR